MSEIQANAIELIPAQVAALTVSGVRRLAARGRMDLLRIEEAIEWLRKGMELHTAAFDDPGWMAVVEAQAHTRSQADRHAQFRTILEFLRLVAEGGDPEEAGNTLNMTAEDRETARTLRSFWPDTSASMVRAVQKERERERADLLRHEERLKRAFLCFQAGYRLDPYNREINYILAEYYSVGLGISRDEDVALLHLRRSAALGHGGAQRALGYRYSASLRGGPEMSASSWFPRSADGPNTGHRSTRAGS
jgi:TPR repeat protein